MTELRSCTSVCAKLKLRSCIETIRAETIQEAFEHKKKKTTIKLIVDGGPENNNNIIDDLIEDTHDLIRKLVAQKDIMFSNSMVEATNKILKYSYLYRKPINNGNDLLEFLKFIFHEFNVLRPHYALFGLTPAEAYSGIQPKRDQYKPKLIAAQVERIKSNQKNSCKVCKEM